MTDIVQNMEKMKTMFLFRSKKKIGDWKIGTEDEKCSPSQTKKCEAKKTINKVILGLDFLES